MTEDVWVLGILHGDYIEVNSVNETGAVVFGVEDVQFILSRGIEGPCLDSAMDLTAAELHDYQEEVEHD